MPNKCCVPGCKGNYDKGPKVPVFKFPKADDELRKKWIDNVPYKKEKITASTVVCIKHFSPHFVKTQETYSHNGCEVTVKIKPRLAPSAYPTIFEDVCHEDETTSTSNVEVVSIGKSYAILQKQNVHQDKTHGTNKEKKKRRKAEMQTKQTHPNVDDYQADLFVEFDEFHDFDSFNEHVQLFFQTSCWLSRFDSSNIHHKYWGFYLINDSYNTIKPFLSVTIRVFDDLRVEVYTTADASTEITQVNQSMLTWVLRDGRLSTWTLFEKLLTFYSNSHQQTQTAHPAENGDREIPAVVRSSIQGQQGNQSQCSQNEENIDLKVNNDNASESSIDVLPVYFVDGEEVKELSSLTLRSIKEEGASNTCSKQIQTLPYIQTDNIEGIEGKIVTVSGTWTAQADLDQTLTPGGHGDKAIQTLPHSVIKHNIGLQPKPKRDIYQCKVCGKVCKQKGRLETHMRVHTGERPYTCHLCGKGFKETNARDKHVNCVHNKIRRFHCSLCSKGFYAKFELNNHMKIHSGEKPFCCHICGKCFLHNCELVYHTQEKHFGIKKAKNKKKLEPRYDCEFCSAKFHFRSQKKQHVQHVHLKIQLTEKRHHCKICNKGFFYKKCLKEHEASHSSARPHECHICENSYKTKCMLQKHLIRHKEKRFFCDICNKGYHFNSALKYHKTASHTGFKRFTCQECSQTFTLEYQLNRHIRNIHIKTEN